jgi:hypothetical protein
MTKKAGTIYHLKACQRKYIFLTKKHQNHLNYAENWKKYNIEEKLWHHQDPLF